MSREVKSLGSKLTNSKPNTPSSLNSSLRLDAASSNDTSKPDCYMKLLSLVENKLFLEDFKSMVGPVAVSENKLEAAASIPIMKNENIENILQHMTLYWTFNEENNNARNNSQQYESYFNSAFYDLAKDNVTYEKLEEICRNYETLKSANVDSAMAEHSRRVAKTTSHFNGKGLTENEAKAAALAISFYSGTKSGVPKPVKSDPTDKRHIEYRSNRALVNKQSKEQSVETFIICHNLLRAVSTLLYYQGYVSRSCRLNDDELGIYTAGSVVIWSQFSGTFKGETIHNSSEFPHRNTFFKIYSLTGRPIKEFSNYDDEDEVLFLPDSTFLILEHTHSHHGTQHVIYMRQVELGISKFSVLWVDDEIFQDKWDNRKYMADAEAKDLKKNLRFIQKSSTDTALSFLESPFGQRLKNRATFRIVSDMHRANEESPGNAGARLIKRLRQLGFNNQCLLFVGDRNNAEETINKELNNNEKKFASVTNSESDLINFINFA
ncbi:unnamed protein product [Rotaria socialis]|uniref:NAD(P)(+)--arginine ADP-ribosyltransferase n=1 Tax=Rotaria socialis TaxID=392032 RepID=A0A821V4J8_9BILA|nr:unnamed protein product [Rotaria socialis]CAF4900490.1 unnamed protein product [Rotaria socialis]